MGNPNIAPCAIEIGCVELSIADENIPLNPLRAEGYFNDGRPPLYFGRTIQLPATQPPIYLHRFIVPNKGEGPANPQDFVDREFLMKEGTYEYQGRCLTFTVNERTAQAIQARLRQLHRANGQLPVWMASSFCRGIHNVLTDRAVPQFTDVPDEKTNPKIILTKEDLKGPLTPDLAEKFASAGHPPLFTGHNSFLPQPKTYFLVPLNAPAPDNAENYVNTKFLCPDGKYERGCNEYSVDKEIGLEIQRRLLDYYKTTGKLPKTIIGRTRRALDKFMDPLLFEDAVIDGKRIEDRRRRFGGM
jgi:hypothetical protein